MTRNVFVTLILVLLYQQEWAFGASRDARARGGGHPTEELLRLVKSDEPCPQALTELLREGAQVKASDSNGMTPLHCAAAMGHERLICQLYLSGGDLEAQNKWGATPLIVAAANGRLEVCRLLVHLGAAAEATNGKGESAQECAERWGHQDIVDFLNEKISNSIRERNLRIRAEQRHQEPRRDRLSE